MHARIAFKKQKRVSERVVWIVSVFDNPSDIVRYDTNTMSRLRTEMFGKTSKAKDKSIIIREILDKIELTRSNITLDEHKGKDKN
jgi:hypothetical protein